MIFERNSHNDIAENERKFKIAQKKAVPLLLETRYPNIFTNF